MKVVILGSGRGSNAEAILEAQARGELGRAKVTGILCDVEGARIISLGERYGVPARHLDPGPKKTFLTSEVEAQWVEAIHALGCDLLVLAGYMRVVKAKMLEAFPNRIINLHPSLLPKYPGLRSIERAWEAGEPESGCTVHWVNAEIDGGAIIEQARVPIETNMSLEALEEAVHAAEHKLLPKVIAELSETFAS